jgi:type VII secretion protein EccE
VNHSARLIAWQLIAVAVVAAIVLTGPARWALCAVALAGAVLTTARWRHRWAYEWLRAGWEFRRASRDQGKPQRELPAVDVAEVRVRGGSKVALLHDGSGFAVIVSAEPAADAPQSAGLPVTALASLMEPGDPVVSAVQFVVHADCVASDQESVAATVYRSLGHAAVPRSQTTWVAIRHDPMASGYAVSAVGTPADVLASLGRTLAARGQRAVQLLTSHGLRAELLGADAARAALDETLVTTGPAAHGEDDWLTAPDGPAARWWSWDNRKTRHVTYRLWRWPAAGLGALHRDLTTMPAQSVTTAVTLTRVGDGRLAVDSTVRVAFDQENPPSRRDRRLRRATGSSGASLVPLHGEHAAGVLATLPLGREPRPPGRGPGARRAARPPVLADAIPVTVGGFVIGTEPGGAPVVVPLFRSAHGTRVCVAGHPALSRLLTLRVLGAGARVQVITMRSAEWLRLRDHAGGPPDQMIVVQPGGPPPAAASRAAPWLVIDDTGAPPAARGAAWQADVTATSEVPVVPGALSGLDAILFERAGPAAEAAIAAAFGLDAAGRFALGAVPAGCLAVVRPGSARVVQLLPDRSEQLAISASLGLPPARR